jgi:hypothetical protein
VRNCPAKIFCSWQRSIIMRKIESVGEVQPVRMLLAVIMAEAFQQH